MTHRLFTVVAALGALTTAAAGAAQEGAGEPGPTPEQRFFDWTAMPFPAGVFDRRRAAVAAALRETDGGVLLVPARDGFSYGETFRQLDDFYYFTGLELPNSVLAVPAEAARAQLFVPGRDARFENPSRPNDYPGRPLGEDPELARRAGKVDVRAYGELAGAVAGWVEAGRPIWVDAGRRGAAGDPASDFVFTWSPGEALWFHLRALHPGADLRNAYEPVARLRMVKGPEEIAVLRRAARLTADGIAHAAGFIRDGVDERTLEAELEAAFKRGGSQRLAFDSIIKSGPNSLWPWRVLAAHYDRRNRAMRDGELVIFDVGCELDHYASDAGRTFPVSGRFSPRQRELVEMATAVADAVIAAVRPGRTFAELQAVAEAAIPPAERRHMQTGLFFGHHIGLAVGDPRLEERPLAPGMVFTVEPWYYNHGEGVAVFLEDDVLVTEEGCENLTASLPRSPGELEALVMAGRAGQR